MFMSEKREFKGVWIPKEIWLCENLTAIEKIILTEIDSLDDEETGCVASNKYLSNFCQCSENKVSLAISKLIGLGLIYIQSFDGRTRVLRSRISKRQTLKKEKADCEENKTINIDDKTYNKKEKQVNLLKEKAFIEETTTTLANVENQAKRFKKPTSEEIQAYCDERENGLNGQQIFDFYQAKGWVIGKSPMKDWKAAVRTWERNRKSVKKTFEGTPNTTLKRTTISIDEALAIRSKLETGDDDYE